jgi:polyketide-type polyunsaturated fatty acid synthase PfaA
MRKPLRIAVVGMSAIFAGSTSKEGFWRDILNGRDLIEDVPEDHWLIADYYDPDPKAPDKTYCKRGSFIPTVEFDALEFGIPPMAVPATDTSQLIALLAAKAVLGQVSAPGMAKPDLDRVSVILGATSAQELVAEMSARIERPVWTRALREFGIPEEKISRICDRIGGNYVPWQESTFPGMLGNVIAGRIANRFGLGGSNLVTDAACASSLAAVSMSINELLLGAADLVITGGCETLNNPLMYICFSKTPALSPTGDCRPFSASADGTILGEGFGMFALKRLDDAERDGNRIYAVLQGLGTSSDGRSKSIYAPLAGGQEKALRRAYEQAGFGPESVELVEAHGTGTVAGDEVELAALRNVYSGARGEEVQWCALGSVKSQVGHTKAAAGSASLFKAVLSLHHKVLPPTIKVSTPTPKLDFARTAFYLNTEARPWIHSGAGPRRAAVSSFGFGGTNFHVALEEYSGPGRRAERIREFPSELVLLGAEATDALISAAERLGSELGSSPGVLEHLARRTQLDFDPRALARLAIVAAGERDLKDKLASAVLRLREGARALNDPSGIYFELGTAEPGPVALLFPGQGSQYPGMGKELAMSWDAAREPWDFASGLRLDPQRRLNEVVFPIPCFSDDERARQAARLVETRWAQPAIVAASLAQLGLLRELGVKGEFAAGHSLGELTALFAAGALEREALFKLSRKRGELLAEAAGATSGAMLAVAGSAERIQELLGKLGPELVVANFNSPLETVLSGSMSAVTAAQSRLEAAEIRCARLQVAAAFHSPAVAGAAEPLSRYLLDLPLRAPAFPVFSNVSAKPYPASRGKIAGQLAKQVGAPVRFLQQLRAMHQAGARTFIEAGPGSVLTRLAKDCLGELPHLAVSLDQRGRDGRTSLWHALGRLSAAGHRLELGALWREYGAGADPRADRKPGLPLQLNGANYGRPKPIVIQQNIVEQESQVTTGKLRLVDLPSADTEEEAGEQPIESEPSAPTFAEPRSQAEGILEALAEVQKQTAQAHIAYQQAMSESHVAFLRSTDELLSNIARLTAGEPLALARTGTDSVVPRARARPALVRPAPAVPAARPVSAPPRTLAPPPARARPVASAPPQGSQAVRPVSAPPRPAAVSPRPASGPVPVGDLKTVLLSVVSKKTGYPPEMLKLEMELEADLGIDSIKRVEIFSILKERVPELSSIPPNVLAPLKSLRQIVEVLEGKATASEPEKKK